MSANGNQRNGIFSAVTRLEVIDHTNNGKGRELVRYGVRVELLLQDDGRTLKVVLTDREEELPK